MSTLDNLEEMTRLDEGRMLHFLAELPEVAEAAFLRGKQAVLPLARPRQVIVCGMGGSAISGDLLRTQLINDFGAPISVHRGDRLPAHADEHTLAIFMSYSGNTGETLSCLKAAIDRKIPSLVISSGGSATALAEAHGLPLVSIPGGCQPRAALGDLFFALLGVASLLPGVGTPQVEATVARLRALRSLYEEGVETARNPAKQLALELAGKTAFLVGANATTEAVALRWKCQINENAKQTVLYAVLPEMTHNDIVNLCAKSDGRLALLAFGDPLDSPFVMRQRAVAMEVIAPHVGLSRLLMSKGDTLLERQLGAIYLGDYVSVYAAFLQGLDPTPVTAIGLLKSRMQDAPQEVNA